MNFPNPKFTIWAVSCITIGLLTAYIDGVSLKGIIGSAVLMSSLICAGFAIAWMHRILKSKPRSDKQKGSSER